VCIVIVVANGEPLEFVEDFTYLGCFIWKDNWAENFTEHLEVQAVYHEIKDRLYNSNVKSILLYGSECWQVVKGDMAKIDAFHNWCLRKNCWLFWPNKISNVEFHKKTGCNSASWKLNVDDSDC